MDTMPTHEACGCEDFAVTRRAVLRGAAGIAGAGVTTKLFGDVFTQVAYGATAGDGNVLVVLSMRGGADGMSIVVPHGDQHYYPARPKISVPRSQLLARDDMFGLHPSLAPLLPMWNAGTFGAVHAVGLPSPNRSHFAAMEEIEDAAPGSSERRGWINRMVGLIGGGDASEAVGLGTGTMMGTLFGQAPTMSLDNLQDLKLPSDGTNIERQTRSLAADGVDRRDHPDGCGRPGRPGRVQPAEAAGHPPTPGQRRAVPRRKARREHGRDRTADPR